MDIAAIGHRLGKQAADAGYAERMARVKQLASRGAASQIAAGAAEGAGQGLGNVVNAYTFGLSDRRGWTHTQDYANDAANKWSKGLALTSAIAAPVGGALKGVARLARGGKAVATAAQAAGAASKAPGLLRATASTLGYFAVPRPAYIASITLRSPSILGKHVAAPVMRGTGRLLARIPGVRGAVSRVAATRGGQALSRGTGLMNAGAQRIAQSRPVQALSNTAKFVEGRGGIGSKMFAVADAGVPMYAGIKYFDPESEAMARALGYDSQYVANVSPTPGMYVPAARMQSPLVNTIPSMVNERRMRDWIAQNQGSIVQEQTDARTQQVADQLSRRY